LTRVAHVFGRGLACLVGFLLCLFGLLIEFFFTLGDFFVQVCPGDARCRRDLAEFGSQFALQRA
jgi:hypothetical protein